jgi:hypothetical protein
VGVASRVKVSNPLAESTRPPLGVRAGPDVRASAASPSHRTRQCSGRAGRSADCRGKKVGEKDERERMTCGGHRSARQGEKARCWVDLGCSGEGGSA